MNKSKIIAYLGKGGSGKSILSSLTAKIAIDNKKKVLLIDADPALGLATALNIKNFKTIGTAREEIIKQARIASEQEENEKLAEIIDYLLLEALYETDKYSMLIMGQTNTVGCFCPINNLLKDTIRAIASNYDIVIIDAEAGLEQINRQVTENVQYPILLTDNSKRGVTTTLLAKKAIDSAPKMDPEKIGVIFNRVNEVNENLKLEVLEGELNYYGNIPIDPLITERDIGGFSPLEMPADSISLKTLKQILCNEKIF